jgi:hypothetical protein
MYAKTDLAPGQELYFDYGYNSKSTQFVPMEHQLVRPKDSKVRVKMAGRTVSSAKGNGKGKVHNVQRVKRISGDGSGSEMDVDRESESYEDEMEVESE